MLLDTETATGRLVEIDRRYRKAKAAKRRAVSMSALRLADLRRVYAARYGRTLPDDDAGRDDVSILAHHLFWAGPPEGAGKRIRLGCEIAAPWMTSPEVAELGAKVASRPTRWKADTLAKVLNLTEAERRRLHIRTIGAVDMTKAERAQQRKLQNRQAHRDKRRANGAKPRAEYEAKSISRAKPWVAERISRKTWYKRHARQKAR
jgi:hypothetical protein